LYTYILYLTLCTIDLYYILNNKWLTLTNAI